MSTNRAFELEVFVQAIDRGNFSAAARGLDLTPSAVSRLVTRLETRLGVQLIQRTTRTLQLTDEGQKLYDRAVAIMSALDEAEQGASAVGEPRGRVAINTSAAFGYHVLVPLIPKLRACHPQLEIAFEMTDRVIDLVEERADIAIRWGALPSSSLFARKLGTTRQVTVASRSYLAARGTPTHPRDLADHAIIARGTETTWQFRRSRTVIVPNLRGGDGECVRRLALSGLGIARLSRFHVASDLAKGTLVPVLEPFAANDEVPIHAVHASQSRFVPARVRVVLEFLATHVPPRLT